MSIDEPTTHGIPWKRRLGEGAVIVLGILIALAADAWWDNRVERADEQTALRQLRAEFADNRMQFDSIVDKHEGGQAAAGVLLDAHLTGTEIPADSLRTLIFTASLPWTYNPRGGALESLVAAGRLDIIEDDSLRVELAAWPGLVEDYREEELVDRAFVNGVQESYLRETMGWLPVLHPRGPEDDRAIRRLVQDRGFADILAIRRATLDEILKESALIRSAIARIRRLIDGSIRP